MPSKKKKYNARFPAGRIKKIMQSDEEVGKVAQAVPIIISRTLELFVKSMLSKTMRITNARNAKTLSPSHLKQCIMSESRFDFLRELVKNIPDITVAEEEQLRDSYGSAVAPVASSLIDETLQQHQQQQQQSILSPSLSSSSSTIPIQPLQFTFSTNSNNNNNNNSNTIITGSSSVELTSNGLTSNSTSTSTSSHNKPNKIDGKMNVKKIGNKKMIIPDRLKITEDDDDGGDDCDDGDDDGDDDDDEEDDENDDDNDDDNDNSNSNNVDNVAKKAFLSRYLPTTITSALSPSFSHHKNNPLATSTCTTTITSSMTQPIITGLPQQSTTIPLPINQVPNLNYYTEISTESLSSSSSSAPAPAVYNEFKKMDNINDNDTLLPYMLDTKISENSINSSTVVNFDVTRSTYPHFEYTQPITSTSSSSSSSSSITIPSNTTIDSTEPIIKIDLSNVCLYSSATAVTIPSASAASSSLPLLPPKNNTTIINNNKKSASSSNSNHQTKQKQSQKSTSTSTSVSKKIKQNLQLKISQTSLANSNIFVRSTSTTTASSANSIHNATATTSSSALPMTAPPSILIQPQLINSDICNTPLIKINYCDLLMNESNNNNNNNMNMNINTSSSLSSSTSSSSSSSPSPSTSSSSASSASSSTPKINENSIGFYSKLAASNPLEMDEDYDDL